MIKLLKLLILQSIQTNINENFLSYYASNFVSSFYILMVRNVFINLKIKNNSKNKYMPLALNELKQVKKI